MNEIIKVLPFLIPGILFQILMQALCIIECVKDNNLTPIKRRVYIITIALFGLPAISFYLFNIEKIQPRDTSPDEVEIATQYSIKGIFFLLLIAYQVMGLHMLIENIGMPLYSLLIILLTISYFLMILYNILPEEKRHATGPLLPILQLLLCIPIQCIDASGDNLFLSIIAGFSAINHTTLNKAKIFGIASIGTYLMGSTARTVLMSANAQMSDLIRYFFVNTLVVALALVAFYTLKKQMVTSIRLESALRTVKEQAEQLKGLAISQERNRIAAEMHDTVGHKLTAAVITLETVEKYIVKQPIEALQKLQLANEQVRQGISELRLSVRAVREGSEADFAIALNQLLKEINHDTGLDIHVVFESEIILPPLQAGILLFAVKECATNAIKHGYAKQADILVEEYKGQLQLTFTDSGCGTDNMQSGSGLSIMRERIEGVGGKLKIDSAPGEGFTVSIIIPIVQRRGEL